MRFLLRHILNGSVPKALVLMYHRVAEADADIWDIAVSPSNFEQHLQVLPKAGQIIPLKELVERVEQKKINRSYIAITFDDGYADNYHFAKPLLEKYKLPATFFITSANIDKEALFWWDELEHLILYTTHLPSSFSMTIGEESLKFDLLGEAQLTDEQRKINSSWKACEEEPPSRRCELFLRLWQYLKVLPYSEQQQQLGKIRSWAGSEAIGIETIRSMSAEELKIMSSNPLFEIGAHTFSHPALAHHSLSYQKQEMLGNRNDLKSITGKDISLLAYPYGNYNSETLTAAAEVNFDAAFTTEEKLISNKSDKFALARYQVKNWNGPEFREYLRQWLSKSK